MGRATRPRVVTRYVPESPWGALAGGAIALAIVIVGAIALAPRAEAPNDTRTQARIEADQNLIGQAGGPVDPASIAAALATECVTEDSENCYWLGGSNGEGIAFVTIEGHVFPLDQILED